MTSGGGREISIRFLDFREIFAFAKSTPRMVEQVIEQEISIRKDRTAARHIRLVHIFCFIA